MIINLFFYLIVFFFSLGQLGRISLNHGTVNFYLYEVFLVIFFSGLFFKFKLKPLKEFVKTQKIPLYFYIWLFFTFIINCFYFAFTENIVAFLYLLRLSFYGVFFIYLSDFIKSGKQKLVLNKSIVLFASITVITSLLQYFFYPNLRNLIYAGWDPHLNRLFGVFFDTSLAAAVYGLIFLYFYKQKKVLFAVLFLIFLILTFSRSAYIIMLLTLLFDILRKKNIKFGLLIFILFFAIFALVPKKFGVGVDLNRTFSISSRLADYQKALTIWQKSPILGFGYNHVQFVKEKMNLLDKSSDVPLHSEASFSSSYLIILVTSGIVGLVLFLLSLGRLFLYNKKSFVYLLFICLLSLTDNIFLQPLILFLTGVIILYDS